MLLRRITAVHANDGAVLPMIVLNSIYEAVLNMQSDKENAGKFNPSEQQMVR